MLKWLRYSGACVTITVNPLHWNLLPKIYQEPQDVWVGPNESTWRASWLMITVKIWIDDGSW
jgi:hypothetical protein